MFVYTSISEFIIFRLLEVILRQTSMWAVFSGRDNFLDKGYLNF
jgi:hypothetical protein